MSDSSEVSKSTPNAADEKLEAAFDQLQQKQEKEQERTQTGSGLGGLVAIFLALIAIGIASYPAYEMYRQSTQDAGAIDQAQARFQASVDDLKSDQDAAVQRISAIERRLDETTKEPDSDQNNLNTLRQEFKTELDSVRAGMNTSSEDWLFAEVEYLIRMANQRVLMERDAASALQLLQSADQIVKDTEGLAAHALRQALAEDIAALKAVDSPDVQGIYLELSALIKQVPELSRAVPTFVPESSTSVEQAGEGSLFDRVAAAVTGAVSRLSQLVDFRRRDEAIKPILPPEQAYYLRQNLILKIQIAQMALLEGEGNVYEISLDEAAAWVGSSFDSDAASKAMQDALRRLSTTPVSLKMPDISSSLSAARELLSGFSEVESE